MLNKVRRSETSFALERGGERNTDNGNCPGSIGKPEVNQERKRETDDKMKEKKAKREKE